MNYKGFDKNFSLEGKTAIVTGANVGIGKCISELFIEKGANVMMASRSQDVINSANRLGAKAKGIVVDISDKADLEKLVKETVNHFGGIDILVNNAGMGVSELQSAEDVDTEAFDATMSVNLRAPFILSKLVAKEMIKAGKGGRIINIASQAGVVAIAGHTAYTTSKAALIGLTKMFALELGKHGISTNAISPTVVMTDMAKKFWVGEREKEGLANIPMGRFAEPEEIAGLALYLASDASFMINGANILIDGGYTIH